MYFFGSNADRMASPIKLIKKSSRIIDATTDDTIQGELIFSVPIFISSPQLGVPAGKPKPRKSREVSPIIEADMEKGINVTSNDMVLGMMCTKIILLSVAPSDRAAMM